MEIHKLAPEVEDSVIRCEVELCDREATHKIKRDGDTDFSYICDLLIWDMTDGNDH